MWTQTWKDAPTSGKFILALHANKNGTYLRAHGPWCRGYSDTELTRENLDGIVDDGVTRIRESFLDCLVRCMPPGLAASLKQQQLIDHANIGAARARALAEVSPKGSMEERRAASAAADKAAHDARVDSLWALCRVVMDHYETQQAATPAPEAVAG